MGENIIIIIINIVLKFTLMFRWYSSMKWTCDEQYIMDFKPWEEEPYE